MSGKGSLERRITDLEMGSGVGGQLYIMRVVFDFGFVGDNVYREVRCLMAADGSENGRCIRILEPGEVVPGLDNPPWLKVEEAGKS